MGDDQLTFQLYSAPTVEARPGGTARVVRNADPELHRVGKQHGPEGERVGTDGGEEDSGDLRVDERTAGGERVGGRSSRGRYRQTVRLYRGEVMLIAYMSATSMKRCTR